MRRTNLFRMVAATVAATMIATAGSTVAANPAGAARPADTTAAPSAGFAPAATNLAQGRPTQESGHADVYDSSRVVDGNPGSYWESVNNSFPQWVQVDLGSSQTVNQVVLKLPTSGWATRTQTLSVQGSANGSSFSDLVGSQTYTFNPASGNTVTINVNPAAARFVRITITANSGWPAGQISELEVYGGGTSGDTTAPSVPGTLSQSTSGSTVTLTWGASTDSGGSGLAGYNVYRDGSLIATLGTVLTYQDTHPSTATVSYHVRARDGAGNLSGNSNTVTRTGTQPPACTNVAQGKSMTASGSTFTFTPEKANDGQLTTYWEGAASYPQNLTVALGANHSISRVTVKLNPDPAWGTRTQTIQVLGRDQASSAYTNLVSAVSYQFVQGSNTVTIPVSATTADVQLRFTGNTGAPSGQVAELEVCGTPAPNPDLVVSSVTWSPTSPSEVSPVTLSAVVRNIGSAAAGATSVNFSLAGGVVGSATVGALGAGASTTVTFNAGTRSVGSYAVAAVVDPANTIVEQNNGNNSFTAASPLVVAQAPGPDLQVLTIASNPPNPAVGASVTFTVGVRNRGTTATGATTVTRLVVGGTTLNTTTASIAAGATVAVAVTGSWTATSGGATITATADATNVVAETNETNNALSQSIVVGRGAAVPYVSYEAEAARYQGTLLETDPLRTFGHTNFATESSGRKSVRLTSAGQFVEFTSTNQANSIVVRNSIPDAPGGGGIEATISLYVNDVFSRKLTLSSRHSWLYGNTDQPESLTNTPQADARRLFDESNALLAQSYPAGTRFKLQRDSGDTASFYVIDMIDLEQVAPAASQPAECTSITSYGAVPNDGLDDTAAIQRAVTDDQNGVINCVWIPAGQWRQEQKILTDDPLNRGTHNQVGISNVTIRGAGMWHSQLYTLTEPQNAGGINHPHEGNFGFDIDKNTQISDIAIFGSGRIRGGEGNAEGGVGLNGRFGTGTRISNVWIEHANVGVWVGRDYDNIPELWGPADGLQFTGMRIRNTYADGINFSNGTRNSRVFNSSFRTTGDDALAVWANPYVKDRAVDIAHDNHFVNNTVQLPWRANGIAIYGGYDNSIENNLIYDTANYPGIMLATDHDPLPFSGTTLIANNGLYRTGGAFWNEDQEFGAITLFPSTRDIVGVTIRDTDIVDSTYDGIQFKNGGGNMPNVAITNVRIDRSNNGAGILAMSGARGNANLTNVTITNSADGNIVIQPGSQFVINP
ncbi:CARDB domain-containing protein [Micromonospora profundi]|uniref:CARDB domain-containing protein n=1 Tax=Micromonospora profundi TaxID=1420889 RepID=A0AAJ6HT90_9ACTN|nr:CARDB domain-containing protein [Micromonospora profundi]WLS45717.1 CARDB domain-containing protein [Micromonospora profundi]